MRFLPFILMILFIGCKDETRNCYPGPVEETTPENHFSRIFSGKYLTVIYNGEKQTDIIVPYDSVDDSRAVITLNSIIPLENSFRIEVALTQQQKDRFLFYGSDSNEARIIEAMGKVTQDTLELMVTFKMTSAVTGKWKFDNTYFSSNEFGEYRYVENSTIDSITTPAWEKEGYGDNAKEVPKKISITKDGARPNGSIDPCWVNSKWIYAYYYLTCPEFYTDGRFKTNITLDYISPSMIDLRGHYQVSGDTVTLYPENRSGDSNLDAILSEGIPVLWKYRENNRGYDIIALRMNREICMDYLFPFIEKVKEKVKNVPDAPANMKQYIDEIQNLIRTAETFEFGWNLMADSLNVSSGSN